MPRSSRGVTWWRNAARPRAAGRRRGPDALPRGPPRHPGDRQRSGRRGARRRGGRRPPRPGRPAARPRAAPRPPPSHVPPGHLRPRPPGRPPAPPPPPSLLAIPVGPPAEAERVRGWRADYWSVGPCFATGNKPDAGPPLGAEGFARVARLAPAGTPVLAIGGITAATAAALARVG